MQKKNPESLHFSSVLSLSKKDVIAFRKTLLKLLEDFEKSLKNSPDEVLYSLGVDWFEV